MSRAYKYLYRKYGNIKLVWFISTYYVDLSSERPMLFNLDLDCQAGLAVLDF